MLKRRSHAVYMIEMLLKSILSNVILHGPFGYTLVYSQLNCISAVKVLDFDG